MANASTEKRIKDSDFYQLVLDSVEDYAVMTTDKLGIVDTWNSGSENLLGYTEDEIIGKDSAIFFTREDRKESADKKELETALKDGRAVDERFHVRKDGSQFWASGKMFPLFDEAGSHIGFTKVMRNMDSRRLAEEQITEARRYAESIVETAREPIIVLNKDLTINSANKAFYELFGLQKKEALLQRIYEAGNGIFNIPKLVALLNRVNDSENGVNDFELEHEWPSLGKKHFRVNARKLVHPTNRSELILFSIEDVTEQRTLEQQKNDFISIASHEIRTPITVIKAYAQILHKRSADTRDSLMTNAATKINEKAEKLMSLVTYLLDVSQLETGEMIIYKEFFNIDDLVVESIEELRLIDPHQFVVKGKLGEPVYADRFRISQVLNNLLNNAIKYSPPDSCVEIQVQKNRKGDELWISIKDSGLGIPKEEQQNLFKRFWRASTARARNISGIGLGLHISSEIVTQHKGRIWLKSEVDKGSVFYFSLPLVNSKEMGTEKSANENT
jgi:PAS domain S-box-containing protein